MPELPEVETTRRGLEPLLRGRRVRRLLVRQPRLRWPVPAGLGRRVAGRRIEAVERRAKYLLLRLEGGTLLWHLGMSGSLRLAPRGAAAGPHDHLDLELEDGSALRFRDPRRFGALLWARGNPLLHPLLARLGPEPFAADFGGAHLHERARGRRGPVKAFLMDGQVVSGLGNIYASEALFQAGIHPARAACRVSRVRYERLAEAVREVLAAAIRAGGTTLRDFRRSDGAPGSFRPRLAVYGRAGEPCERCGGLLRSMRLGQRASVYCPGCQS